MFRQRTEVEALQRESQVRNAIRSADKENRIFDFALDRAKSDANNAKPLGT